MTEICNKCGGNFAWLDDGLVQLLACTTCGREVPASAFPSPSLPPKEAKP